jgi:hypothetical protein
MAFSPHAHAIATLRPARADDAATLAEIRNAWTSSDGGGQREALGLLIDEVDFLDRLAIPHGEDYFCLVAEIEGEVVGYVIGGGSRDLDRKAYSEVYEIAIRRTQITNGVAESLLARAIQISDEAAFAGLLLSVPVANLDLRELALRVGLHDGGRKHDDQRLMRFNHVLPAPDSKRA